MPDLTDTQRLVLDTLAQAEPRPDGAGRRWLARYLRTFTGGESFSDRLARLHRERFPERRNQPQHRHIEGALRTLMAEGLVEDREGEHDYYYRLTPAGEEAV